MMVSAVICFIQIMVSVAVYSLSWPSGVELVLLKERSQVRIPLEGRVLLTLPKKDMFVKLDSKSNYKEIRYSLLWIIHSYLKCTLGFDFCTFEAQVG